jgi:eukaryotic-like serine/threonine-protein kinase
MATRSGSTLEDRLRAQGRMELRDLARLIRDVLQALVVMHRQGLIHRDVRPKNVLLDDEGRAYLIDHGVRKIEQKDRPAGLDSFDPTLNTFACMAPEAVRGQAMDARADVYGVGAVGFRALTGRTPFQASNALTAIALKLDRDPPSLSDVTGDVWPPELERFLARSMAREREARFASAEEALHAWVRICGRWLPQPS